MAIPKFEDFLYPFLLQLAETDVTTKEMYDALVTHFGLTEEECTWTTRSGASTQVKDRIGWARQWLRRALFIEIPQRGVYRITQRGKEYLEQHNDLRQEDLLYYKEFADYAGVPLLTRNDSSKTKAVKEANDMFTPTELLEKAFHEINIDLAAEVLQRTLDMSPQKFEAIVLDLLLAMGYGNPHDNSAKVTQYSNDNGIDGVIPQDKLGLDKIYIQAKRYKTDNAVGKPAIQAFSGALDEQKANKGVFITTSSFTKEAQAFVGKISKKIILIDGKQLARYMVEFNVGVSKQKIYEIKKIDTDYFIEE